MWHYSITFSFIVIFFFPDIFHFKINNQGMAFLKCILLNPNYCCTLLGTNGNS